MPKRTRESSAYPRVSNHQKFSTFRLIPVINQKNYFTNYLKKDSQYMCRKIRERSEDDDSQVVVLQLGSRNLRIGFSSDPTPKCLPFNLAKKQALYSATEDPRDEEELNEQFDGALTEIQHSFVDRMKFYKTRIVNDAKQTCQQFNSRQRGEPVDNVDDDDDDLGQDGLSSIDNDARKLFCLTKPPPKDFNLFWPFSRGALNENPEFYRSPQEVANDIYDILHYASTSKHGLGISDLKKSGKYDLILIIPDLQERTALVQIVDILFELGYANVALIEEAVAATYGAGISAACVVDIGAQTTTVSCVDDGACLSNSRVKLDFGSEDITRVFSKLLDRVSFPGEPDFETLDKLKQRFCTVNEADISVQLYQYINTVKQRKYDFKVYNEVMLPIFGLFYPEAFNPPPRYSWRFSLFPQSTDPYTGHTNEPISDADINIRLGTLSIFGQSYQDSAQVTAAAAADAAATAAADDDDVSLMDVDSNTTGAGAGAGDGDDDMSREGTPLAANSTSKGEDKASESESLPQLKAHESLDLTKPAIAALDHAIIESIHQAAKQGGDAKQYYENLLVIGGGSKVPSFHVMLTDRLVMWNQSQLKEIGEVGVMAMPREMDPESICWKGGSVYSKLKIIDEMWTTKEEWDTLGARTLHYKAALYVY